MLRRIKVDWAKRAVCAPLEAPFTLPETPRAEYAGGGPESYTAFLDVIGHVGMGGSGFPTSEKITAAKGAHTLVINGVECEPGIMVDQSVLLHESRYVLCGANASAQAVEAGQVVLAVKNTPELCTRLEKLYPDFTIVPFPDRYPAGAEKLILKKLTGNIPSPGMRPYQFGYLVQNAVSLRAIGRAILDGIPVIERPLTLANPSTGFYRNLVVPVGMPIMDVLTHQNVAFDPKTQFIADSGLMMGREVDAHAPVEKTTLAILVLEQTLLRRTERPCIRCGACNTACPLGLHPFTLTEHVRKGQTTSEAFRQQMTECFLCGVCSVVCPSDIPLVQLLERGKQCL